MVHDIRLLDENPEIDGQARSANLPLTAGWHPVRLYYRCTVGIAKASLTVTGEDGKTVPLGQATMKTLPFIW